MIKFDYDGMLKLLEKLVNIDSGSHDKAGVDLVGSHLKKLYTDLGFEIKETEHEKYGNCMVLSHKDALNPNILVLAHMDTVYPKGTALERPFNIQGDRAYGPGIIDMKVSQVMLYYTIKHLIETKDDSYKKIEIILNGDEQIGSSFSRTIIEERARLKEYVLVLEPARVDGSIVSARRGIAQYELEVKGIAAHTGIDPSKGINAITEIAHKIVKLDSLTDHKNNIDVSTGLIEGGEAINTIAPFAKASIDVRFNTKEEGIAVDERIRKICEKSDVPGTEITLSGGINRPPMMFTDGVKFLVELVLDEAQKLGLDVNHTATGGGSDAAFTADMNIPTVDGLGAVGGNQNNEKEYLELDSLIERTNLLTNVINRLSRL